MLQARYGRIGTPIVRSTAQERTVEVADPRDVVLAVLPDHIAAVADDYGGVPHDAAVSFVPL